MIEHSSFTIGEDMDGLFLRSELPSDPGVKYFLWQVTIVTREDPGADIASVAFVLAANEKAACSQATCGRPQVVSKSAVKLPLQIRGFGSLTL